MKKLITASAITAALLGAPLASQAAEADPVDFEVRLTLLASCTINEATDLDFGTLTEDQVINDGTTSTSTITVTCSNGADYSIGLSGTNGSRTMTTANGSSVAYELYQPDGSTAWEEGTPAQEVVGEGNGEQQDFIVNGEIPTQSPIIAAADNISDGGIDLTDTVTVTVTF